MFRQSLMAIYKYVTRCYQYVQLCKERMLYLPRAAMSEMLETLLLKARLVKSSKLNITYASFGETFENGKTFLAVCGGPVSASIAGRYKDLTINFEQVRLEKCLRVNPHVNSPYRKKDTKRMADVRCARTTRRLISIPRGQSVEILVVLPVCIKIMTHAHLKHAHIIPSKHAAQLFPLGLVPAGLQIQGHAAVEWTHLAVQFQEPFNK